MLNLIKRLLGLNGAIDIDYTIDILRETLVTVERAWILDNDANLKHIRRGVIDSINSMLPDTDRVRYSFDPANPGPEHDKFVAFNTKVI